MVKFPNLFEVILQFRSYVPSLYLMHSIIFACMISKLYGSVYLVIMGKLCDVIRAQN